MQTYGKKVNRSVGHLSTQTWWDHHNKLNISPASALPSCGRAGLWAQVMSGAPVRWHFLPGDAELQDAAQSTPDHRVLASSLQDL